MSDMCGCPGLEVVIPEGVTPFAGEAGRVRAETERIKAESERKVAEGERQKDEAARLAAETLRLSAEAERQVAEKVRQSAVAGQVERATKAAEEAESVQAALHLRRRVLVGTAADVELLMPGDELIITDDSSLTHVTDYQDLLLEAQAAAAGENNNLETLAVLSVVNATNLRRTADGLLWTTDTLANFREKLTAFAAAAVAGGYVTTDGQCIATWAQAQAWLLDETLFSPIDAETKDYTWRKAAPKTEYDAIKEDVASIKAQLGEGAGTINTLITGGTRQ